MKKKKKKKETFAYWRPIFRTFFFPFRVGNVDQVERQVETTVDEWRSSIVFSVCPNLERLRSTLLNVSI